METTLKPCPFCGGKAVFDNACVGRTKVECEQCDVYLKEGPGSGPSAEKQWNTRAPTPREQELEAQNKALWELVEQADSLIRDYAEVKTMYSGDSYDIVRGAILAPTLIPRTNTLTAAIQKQRKTKHEHI
jgi:Lar family restriction alleviation protein